jgi:uncharacterized membrane-anchored protein
MNAQQLLQRAQQAQLLPGGATLPLAETRPWPVILLTALGAWLAVVPFGIVISLLLGDAVRHGPTLYLLGLALLVVAVIILRQVDLPLFVEQLALPALLVGGGCLAGALGRDLAYKSALLLTMALVVLLTLAIPKSWLRTLFGALLALLALLWLGPEHDPFDRHGYGSIWFAAHLLLALLCVVWYLQSRPLLHGDAAGAALVLEQMSGGYVVALLVTLLALAGQSFLLGHLDGSVAMGNDSHPHPVFWLQRAVSLLLCLLAALWLGWRDARTRAQRAWLAGPVLALALLSWHLPTLGATLLLLVLLLDMARFALASAAGLAVLWIIGSFYYQLDWSLSQKALLLTVMGALLGALALLGRKALLTHEGTDVGAGAGAGMSAGVSAGTGTGEDTHASADADTGADTGAGAGTGVSVGTGAAAAALRARRPLAALTGILTLLLINSAIWQKQDLIAHGQPVWLKLIPVDPRSLMQGDYMRLNFEVPPVVESLTGSARPHAVARRDARGVASLSRIWQPGQPLAADELLIELTPKNGYWIVVSDAWFFEEGQGARFARAKYGEFRVLPDGRALLVGLADEQLTPLTRAP